MHRSFTEPSTFTLATPAPSSQVASSTAVSTKHRNFHPELLPVAIIYTLKSHQENRDMASFAANGMADVPTDHPQDDHNVGAKPWLEPWLIKHSSFYRKHFTKNGDGMTKSERRASVVSQEEERIRKQSTATEESADGKVAEQSVGV